MSDAIPTMDQIQKAIEKSARMALASEIQLMVIESEDNSEDTLKEIMKVLNKEFLK